MDPRDPWPCLPKFGIHAMLLLFAAAFEMERQREIAAARAGRDHLLKIAIDCAIIAYKMKAVHSCHRDYLTFKDPGLVLDSSLPWSQLKAALQDMGALQINGLTWSSFDDLLIFFTPVIMIKELWALLLPCKRPGMH